MDTGKDFVGTSKNDLFLALDDSAAAKTLTLADSIDGGKGTEDTLKIVTAGAIDNDDFSSNTIKGIEIVDIKSTGADVDLNTTADAVKNNFKDVTDLNITTTTAAAAGDITATVNGTTNVTATATGAGASITVTGGKAVSATATAAITGDALTTVTVKGGNANTIDNTDADGNTSVGETLKSVTFEANAAGTNTVKGNAIDTLTLKDQIAALTTTITNDKSTALTVNLNNVNGATVNAGTKAETVTINSNGTNDNTLELHAATSKTLNIAGDAAFTLLTGSTLTVLESIVVTNTKGVTITDVLETDVKFTGGTGADSVKLKASFEKAINMGAGDDTVTYAAASTVEGKVGSVDAGAGKDTIIMTSVQANGITTDAFNTAFKNFEVLQISDALTSAIDLEKINNVSEVELAVDGNTSTISNLVSGGRVAFLAVAATSASTNNLTVDVKNATTGTSDVLNLDLKAVATGAVDFGTVTAANVETINITAADIDTTAAGSAAEIAELALVATSATKVVVSGNNGLDLTGTTGAKITTFDASGVVANGTADADANLAVTFTSTNITAGEAVTIIGGAGDDELTGTAQANDTITGGKGIDTITYTGGKDTFTGGEGADKFVIGAKTAASLGTKDLYLTISDLGKGDSINVASLLNNATTVDSIAKISVASGATFDQALNAAAIGNGGTNSLGTWFQYQNNTYLVADNSSNDTFIVGQDSFIKIAGLVDLSTPNATVVDGVITIA